MLEKMELQSRVLCSLVFAVSSLAIMSQSCSSDYFSAVFTGTVD